MAYEWIGWVSSGAVGLGGLYVANRSGERQKEAALEVADRQIRGQADAASKSRQHDLLQSAYNELLRDLSAQYDWVRRVYPVVTFRAEDNTIPPMPPLPGSDRSDAILVAYWSTEVRALVNVWAEHVTEVWRTGMMIRFHREQLDEARLTGERSTSGAEASSLLWTLEKELRKAVWDADEAVRARIRYELLGDVD